MSLQWKMKFHAVTELLHAMCLSYTNTVLNNCGWISGRGTSAR